MAGNHIVLHQVTKIFGEESEPVVAVDNLSLEVPEGWLVTLLGPSGCGKTTTLRMVAGFEFPTAGEIYIGGERVDHILPNKRDTAMVFQSYGLFPHMTVFENVAYGLKVRRIPRQEIRRRVAEVLELTGLKGLEDRAPQQLSGGQQQRVALSRALVVQPKVLLFDEPLSNLDAKLRVEMRSELRKLQKRLSITSLYVTHDQEEAMSISDLLCVMHKGKVQQIGSPTEIYTRPANHFVADFIGQANFLSGVIERIEGKQAVIRIQDTILPILLPNGTFSRGEPVELVVRPEGVDFTDQGIGDFDGIIQFVQYTGSKASYEVELPMGMRLSVEVANPQERGLSQEGEVVGLVLHRNSLHLLPKREE